MRAKLRTFLFRRQSYVEVDRKGLVSAFEHQRRIDIAIVAAEVAMSLRVEMAYTYVCDNVLPSKGS